MYTKCIVNLLKNIWIEALIAWFGILMFLPIVHYIFLISNKTYIPIDYTARTSLLRCGYIKQDFKKSNVCVWI